MIGAGLGFWIGFRHGWRGLGIALLVVLVLVGIGQALYHGPVHRRVSVDTVPAASCGYGSQGVRAVWLTDDSSEVKTYEVECADGSTTYVK